MSILEVQQLSISFLQGRGKQTSTQAITSLDLSLEAGEILAVVGSSGSGKSLLAHAILGILPDHAKMGGTIVYDGEPLTPERQAALRGRDIALIPQAVSYLDPLMKAGAQVRTAVRDKNPLEAQREVFEQFRLDPGVEEMYPFQLSGGMARRVLVSMAMVSGAKVLIADEPTPGLDESVMEEALRLFRQCADRGAAVMLITHDLESALRIADRIAVFYAGTTVEIAPASDFAGRGERLRHPYSRALWRALPQNDFQPIPGSQPAPDALPPGCVFEPRCDQATAECAKERPEHRALRGGSVRCIHAT